MVERNVLASFTGQLFEAPAATKKWTSISSSNASIQVMNIEDGSHQIIGLDKDQEVHILFFSAISLILTDMWLAGRTDASL